MRRNESYICILGQRITRGVSYEDPHGYFAISCSARLRPGKSDKGTGEENKNNDASYSDHIFPFNQYWSVTYDLEHKPSRTITVNGEARHELLGDVNK